METRSTKKQTVLLISEFLKKSPGVSARMIAAELGVDKSSINSLLYSNLKIFERIGDKPPLWHLKDVAGNSAAPDSVDQTRRVRGLATPMLQTDSAKAELHGRARRAEAAEDFALATVLYELLRRDDMPTGEKGVSGQVAGSSPGVESDSARDEVEQFVRGYPGITIDELSIITGLTIEQLRVLTRNVRHLITTPEAPSPQFSDLQLQLLDGIATAGTMAFPLSSDEYDDLVRKGMVFGRTSARINQIFGSWRKACELAGVESPKPLRGHYDNRWTVREMSEVVARYLVVDVYRGSHHNYERWRADEMQANELPSQGTLKNHLGPSWTRVRNHGLEILRESWASKSIGEI